MVSFILLRLISVIIDSKIFPVYQSNMVAPRASSDEEEPDLIRHSLPKDTAAQEVVKKKTKRFIFQIISRDLI